MLSIRLFRTGKKKQAFFKLVVTDKRNSSSGGRFIEQLGFINPLTKEKSLKADRIKHWISKGAQPSDTVHNLLINEKIIEGDKIPMHKMKKDKGDEKEASKTEAPKEEVKPEIEAKPEEPKQEETKEEEKKEEPKEEAKPEEPKKEEPKEEKPKE